jgi:hypothetical protein
VKLKPSNTHYHIWMCLTLLCAKLRLIGYNYCHED